MSSVRRYRKKPIIVEAVKWDGSVDAIRWVNESGGDACPVITGFDDECPVIGFVDIATGPDGSEEELRVSPGDYIIRGIQGEFYPCKPGIFEATYEPVEEA